MIRFSCALILLALSFATAQSKGWRGITPLKSTCADVKRIFNVQQCAPPMSEYTLPDFKVVVFLTDDDGCDDDPRSWNVPKGTITSLTVSPTKTMTPRDFGIDLKNFTKLKPGDVVGAEGFENREEGIEIHLFKEFIDYVVFFPSKNDEVKRCKKRKQLVRSQSISSSKRRSRYPNELATLKLYKNAKWNSLKPYVSTIDEVQRILGKPTSVYDESLNAYVAGYQDDPNWIVLINVVGNPGDIPEAFVGRILEVEILPKKRISLVGADFSSFRGTSCSAKGEQFISYYDKFGLRYVVYDKDSSDGRFRAGDLLRIDYGPSEEDTEQIQKMHGQ